jgi:hypothetical protein
VRGEELRGPAFGRQVLGCIMDPPAMDAYASGQACFTTIYEERIQKVLDEALRRQRYFLRHSLVAAYVRADFDAFRDVKIRDALISARKILLEHPDRMLVELADVADDEPGVPTGDGKLWKAQLRARGVKEKHPLMGGAGRLADRPPGTLVPPSEPPPKVPLYEGPLAWGELHRTRERPLAGEDRRSHRGGAPTRRRRDCARPLDAAPVGALALPLGIRYQTDMRIFATMLTLALLSACQKELGELCSDHDECKTEVVRTALARREGRVDLRVLRVDVRMRSSIGAYACARAAMGNAVRGGDRLSPSARSRGLPLRGVRTG